MASHELTLKNYQTQLKDNIRLIYENYTDILKTRTEHVNFEVQVKSAEIVRCYQSLMQLVAEIRTFLIINDLVNIDHNATSTQAQIDASLASQSDDKLVKLRDEMSTFLYELEIPLP